MIITRPTGESLMYFLLFDCCRVTVIVVDFDVRFLRWQKTVIAVPLRHKQ
jgi:hypothetical protein